MSNSEPESYDLNAMMDKLRSRSGEDAAEEQGQLVTRADGSQAIKVRRRKRRSEQPHKKSQRRARVVQVTAMLVVVLLVVLGLGLLMVYVNSSPFHVKVQDKVARVTGAKVELNQFRMNPSGANAMGLDLSWPAGNLLESGSFRLMSAKVTPMSFFGGVMGGQELEAATGRMVLRLPEAGAARVEGGVVDGELPIQFDQYGVKDVSLQMRVAEQVVVRLDKAEATLVPAKKDMAAQLILYRGDLGILRWPKMRLDRALVEFPGDQIEVVGMRVRGAEDNKGLLELSGILAPYDGSGDSQLALSAESFLSGNLLGDQLGGLFSGRIDSDPTLGPSKMAIRFGQQPKAVMELNFKGTPATAFQMKNFPFLYALSQTLADEWFSQPEFEDIVRGRIVREGGRVQIQSLDLMSKKRLVVRGGLGTDSAGRLEGRLRVGVAYTMVNTSENQVLEQLFGEPQEGFRWVDLEISGTPKHPKDNFGALYEKTLEALKHGDLGRASGEKPSFEDLTRPR